MRILALTVGDPSAGSTHFRLMQYLPFLRERGIGIDTIAKKDLDATILDRLGDYDLLFNQKCLLPLPFAKKIVARSRCVLFDFDDAVYTRPGGGYGWWTGRRVKTRLQYWLCKADCVVAANGFLADYASKYRREVCRLPMALDLELWRPKEEKARNAITSNEVNIGWAGAPVNLWHVERLDGVLTHILKRYSHVRLKIFSGKAPCLSTPFDFHPFASGKEALFVPELDIGLLPLTDEEFSYGKSPIKALQYLACGVPVVGNRFGGGGEILTSSNSMAVTTDEQWIEALEYLIENPHRCHALGAAGRNHVEQNFNKEKVALQLYEQLHSFANRG